MNQMDAALDALSGDGESLYRVVLCVPDVCGAAEQVREVVRRTRGDLRRLTQDSRRQSSKVSLRNASGWKSLRIRTDTSTRS
jgi:hypothetical protein